MNEIVISAESLGKKYVIGKGREREPYVALRDVIARRAARAVQIATARHRVSASADKQEEMWALTDVSFDVRHGEVLGIIGRNGAGKSTLLKILSRITEPSKGRVSIRGRVASLLEVGTGFHAELTGRENIFLNGAILGMARSEIRRKFDEIVAFAEVDRFLDTPVKRYSSGMYVRLAFAVAAHLEPEILIVDEVLAVGDAQFQKKCLGKMGSVARDEGRTILFVSHNMTAVRALCSRVLLMSKGSVEFDGPSEVVTSRYLSGGVEPRSAVSWHDQNDAPGSGGVWLKAARARPLGVEEDGRPDVTTPIEISIDYFVAQSCMLHVSLLLYTQEDVCVLNDGSPSTLHTAGMHRATCLVPGGLLNDETYRVRVLLVRDGSTAVVDRDHLIAFEVGDIERDGAWFGKWLGVVRPAFRWTQEPLGDVVGWS